MSGISLDEVCNPREGPGRFGWSLRHVDGTVVVHVAGELDLSTATELRRRLMSVAESGGTEMIVLDLSDVRFIDAGSIGLVVSARTAAERRGRQLLVDGLHGMPGRVFGVLGLEWMVRRTSEDGAGGDAGGRYEPAGNGRRRFAG